MEAMLKPLVIGRHTLANRFVMAPLTRCRADDEHVPTEAMVKYYADRAGFGLIICEATQIQKGYSSFAYEGGIFGKEQVAGWRKVTDAVHAKGGVIFCQLHNCGRSTVAKNLDDGLEVIAASPIPIVNHKEHPNFIRGGTEKEDFPVPRELTVEEIQWYVKLYATAAKNAMAAGFDGVQIHGANSYLIDGFLRDGSNKRTDEYGGSIENRCRFLLEVVDACIEAVGHQNVGLRISPLNSFNDMEDSDPEALTRYVCKQLNSRKLAFLDVMRGDFFSATRGADVWARDAYEGVLISGMGYELDEAEREVAEGKCDAVCFGVKAIANPDLVHRAIAGAPLNQPDFNTFYTRDEHGYNDYPTLVESRRASLKESLEKSLEKSYEKEEAKLAAEEAALRK